ncbi:hypothetical protein RM549_07190 [Salegentibacter sp. F188]|uniref:Curlin associated repeat-containing protein n=1 Tax=Autumnicola patrickiae TaxID=3075591 RepID=A0ABU3E0Z0_9FLAO|nr:hypothetical protein [Salegentibacter sp. F188]MDT0689563.1 hypothetical protein [Salegentibacter sp. F188]
MKNFSNWIVIVVIFFSQFSFSQTERDLEMMQKMLEFQKIESVKTTGSSQVFIEQIGGDNNLVTRISAESSNVSFIQNGQNNDLLLDINSETYHAIISQLGNSNKVSDDSYAPYEKMGLDLTQTGNNNDFQRYGSNSIGNNLKFSMTGEDQTVIVRNFK